MKQQKIFAAFTDAVSERELKNKDTAYQAALEGIVLLKNDGALPVEPGKIALFGAGVPMTVKGGTGSGEVNERHAVSILEGMEAAGYQVVSKSWIQDYLSEYENSYKAWKKGFKLGFDMINYMSGSFQLPAGRSVTEQDVREAACDTAIYIVARQAGEGKDKKIEDGEFDLTAEEINSFYLLKQHYKKAILVINSGAYMNLSNLEIEAADAVIFFCQQGMEGGRAFADIISGKVSPSGKLTDSWAKTYADVPCGDEYSYRSADVRQQVYKEGIYVGYRYYDTYQVPVCYPFGFGLSYTQFDIQCRNVELIGDRCSLTVSVKNTGTFSGKEVVQLYVSCPDGKLKKEYQRLSAFAKTNLLARGEEQSVTLTFTLPALASYSEAESAWILERGDYILRLGNSSVKTVPVAVIRLSETLYTEKVRRICPVVQPFTEITPVVRQNEAVFDCPILTPVPGDVVCRTASYELPKPHWSEKTNRLLDSLTPKEMIDITVGTGLLGMVDSRLNYAPGTVGRTTGRLAQKGLLNVNLADGPAGLRLLRESALSPSGQLRFIKGNYMLSAMNLLPEGLMKAVMAKEQKSRKLYQYTTAFPVGTALAQSWNTELCEAVGIAISNEMSEYGITYWLGPAMNIHRNPLCGRNFEYLSEDPLLTGKIAAALTRGAQSIPGNYATIKHFACNNAEEQRTHSNSVIHERALREIYLRGFEICVKEAAPASVMTSYNLLNGVYTPDSYDLCTAVLRCEWGFKGVVMTDWISTGAGQGTAAGAIAAGNDLIMPGSGHDKRSIRTGLRKGEVTVNELRTAAGNIIDAILKGAK